MGKLAINGGNKVREKEYPNWPIFGTAERDNLLKVFESGRWWFGKYIKIFEEKFAEFQDAKYGIACCNGTIALEIALLSCGIGAGDEVIVPSYSFIATATAVLKVNAIPIFADINLKTANIDPNDIKKKITKKTTAIIPVHFGGLPCDMDSLKALAKKHNLKLVEDSCHSWGSKWRDKGTGAIGDCGIFSFQMSKNITSGEGGIFISDNKDLAEKAWSYHNCGRKQGKDIYEHYLLGGNFRLTELQAAILLGQLTRLEKQTTKREKNAQYLDEKLREIPGIALIERDARVTRRAYHMYIFRFLSDRWEGVRRQKFLQALQAEGIPCWTGYPVPLYKNPLFLKKENGKKPCPFSCPYFEKHIDYANVITPNTEVMCKESVWIPHSVLLSPQEGMKDIVRAISKIWDYRDELRP